MPKPRLMTEEGLAAHNKRIAAYKALPKSAPSHGPLTAQKRPTAKPARQKGPSEHQIQAAVIAWWDVQGPSWGYDHRLLFAIPNGQWLAGDARQRAMLMQRAKAEGLRVGMLDLMLAVPRFDLEAGGLVLEMKSDTGRTSDAQIEMIEILRRRGYHVVVCWTAEEAQRAITGYLGK